MTRLEFELRVRHLSSLSDFAKNEHLLEVIDSSHFELFLNCLTMCGKIKPSFKALDTLNELSKETAIGSDDILNLLPKFRLLFALFDERSPTADPTSLPIRWR